MVQHREGPDLVAAAWEDPVYRVAPLYGAQGEIAPHFSEEPAKRGCDFEGLLDDPVFNRIIESELAGEAIADACLAGLSGFAPSGMVAQLYLKWLGYMNAMLDPWQTGGAIHFRPRWARVMLLALVLGEGQGMSQVDLEALCMAAVFHDSRRANPYLDTGHGARAARYYLECSAAASNDAGENALPPFDPRVYLAIRWHDRDDSEGLEAISRAVEENRLASAGVADLRASLPEGARAGFQEIYLTFKDADGLDRVRLDVEGDPDVRYFRTPDAVELLPFARSLLAATDSLA